MDSALPSGEKFVTYFLLCFILRFLLDSQGIYNPKIDNSFQ
jgi:hypothetical protein